MIKNIRLSGAGLEEKKHSESNHALLHSLASVISTNQEYHCLVGTADLLRASVDRLGYRFQWLHQTG